MVEPDKLTPPSVRIYLVHGTFAPKARWTREGVLIETLRDEISKHAGVNCQDIEFVPCNWADTFLEAWFTQAARDRGLDRVQKFLGMSELNVQIDKGQLVYFLAHSHGGNIILDAVSNLRLDGKVRGVICMNTPFLVMFKRNFSTIAARVLQTSLALAVVLLTLLHLSKSCRGFGCFQEGGQAVEDTVVVLAIASLLLAGLAAISMFARKRNSFEKWRSAQEKLVESFSGAPIVRTPVLSAWNAGDEILVTLRTLQSVSDVPFIILHPLMILILFLANLFYTAPHLHAWAQMGEWNKDSSPEAWLLLLMAIVLTPLVYVLIAVAGLFLNLFCLVFPVAGLDFGAWRNSFITRLAVGYLPIKVADSTFVEFNLKSSWLNHSRIYLDDVSLKHFATWISNDIKQAQANSVKKSKGKNR